MPFKFYWIYVFIVVASGCAMVPPQPGRTSEVLSHSVSTPDSAIESKAAVPAPVAAKSEPPIRVQVQIASPAERPVDVWTRIRAGFSMADSNDPAVQEGEAWYASRPDYMQRIFSRSQRYLFHIVEEVKSAACPLKSLFYL